MRYVRLPHAIRPRLSSQYILLGTFPWMRYCHVPVDHFNPLSRSYEVTLATPKDKWLGILLMTIDTVLDQVIATAIARSLITRRTRFAKSVLRSEVQETTIFNVHSCQVPTQSFIIWLDMP